jgi:hypothetical protein
MDSIQIKPFAQMKLLYTQGKKSSPYRIGCIARRAWYEQSKNKN